MRISTNTVYQNSISKINDITAQQYKLQQQLSSQTTILTPSDDPVGAAQSLQINQAQSLNTQYASNRTLARNNLEAENTTMQSVSDLVLSMQQSIVAAGDGSYDNSQRADLATQLTSSMAQLMSLANSKDSNGNYIFGGFKNGSAPFTQTPTGATYNGDSGQQLLQVSSDRQMAVNDSGSSVFQPNGAGGSGDIFKTLTDAINALNTPVVTSADAGALSTSIATANAGLQTALTSVLTTQASVGSKLSDLDSLDTFGKSQDLNYAKALDGLQNMSASQQAQAISDQAQLQLVLQAAQKSFVAITSLSLFSLLP